MEIEIMMFWISSIYIGPIWALMWFALSIILPRNLLVTFALLFYHCVYHMQLSQSLKSLQF